MAMRKADEDDRCVGLTNLERFVEALAKSCARHRIDQIRERRRQARSDSRDEVKVFHIDPPGGS